MIKDRVHGAVSKTSWGRVFVRLIQNLDRHDTPRVASAMAFDAFLSIIPLVAIAGYALQRLHSTGNAMITALFKAAPPPVGQLVDLEFLRLSDAGGAALAPISLTAFLWVSSSGISTAIGVIETIYAAELRPWWVRRAIAMVCVVGGFIAIVVTAAIAVGIASLTGSFIGALISLVTPGFILVGLIAAFYWIAIRRSRLPHRRIFPGAVVTVALWGGASALFSLYVRNLAQYATLYGNLATVAILLLWLWLLAMALIVGSEVNAELERKREAASSKSPTARISWQAIVRGGATGAPDATDTTPTPDDNPSSSKPPAAPLAETPIPITLPARGAAPKKPAAEEEIDRSKAADDKGSA